jgi:carbon monoxide dehydrogenase subunit G
MKDNLTLKQQIEIIAPKEKVWDILTNPEFAAHFSF